MRFKLASFVYILVIHHTSPSFYNITGLQGSHVHPGTYVLFRDTTFHLALVLFTSLHPKQIWNLLPLNVCQSQTYSSFRRHLKTH